MIHVHKRRTMELRMSEISISSIMRPEPPIENSHPDTCLLKCVTAKSLTIQVRNLSDSCFRIRPRMVQLRAYRRTAVLRARGPA